MNEVQYYNHEVDMEKAGKIIKSIIVLVMFILAGLLFFRFFLNGFYPRDMRSLIPTPSLQAALAEGHLSLETQEIRVPYDDPNKGQFFAKHVVFDRENGSLQVSVRWNRSTLDKLEEKYGDAFSREAEPLFTYRIFCAAEEGAESILLGGQEILGESYLPVATREDSLAMYSYERLAFEGIRFEGVYWIRLEVYIAGAEGPEADIVIFENHEEYSVFEEYKMREGELS